MGITLEGEKFKKISRFLDWITQSLVEPLVQPREFCEKKRFNEGLGGGVRREFSLRPAEFSITYGTTPNTRVGHWNRGHHAKNSGKFKIWQFSASDNLLPEKDNTNTEVFLGQSRASQVTSAETSGALWFSQRELSSDWNDQEGPCAGFPWTSPGWIMSPLVSRVGDGSLKKTITEVSMAQGQEAWMYR